MWWAWWRWSLDVMHAVLMAPIVVFRLLRNAFAPDAPPVFRHDDSVDVDWQRDVASIVSVKDTCSQSATSLLHLRALLPRVDVYHVSPRYPGCDVSAARRLALPRVRFVLTAPDAPVATAYASIGRAVRVAFVLFLHNDVYAFNAASVAALRRALLDDPSAAFAAPNLYERSREHVMAPHNHFHAMRVHADRVAWSLDVDMITKRARCDYTRRPRDDLMEDHAFMGRAATFASFIDPRATHTLEFLDMALEMRNRSTRHVFVPTAQFLFDVDERRVTPRDVAFLAYRRHEELALATLDHMSRKWGLRFPTSRVWDYIKLNTLRDAFFTDVPADDAALVYYAWFHVVGFNRFDRRPLHEFETVPRRPLRALATRGVRVSRAIAGPAAELPSFSVRHEHHCHADRCGMLVVHDGVCHCFTYEMPFRSERTTAHALLDLVKVPSRVLTYVQLQLQRRAARAASGAFECAHNCSMVVPRFDARSTLLTWRLGAATPTPF